MSGTPSIKPGTLHTIGWWPVWILAAVRGQGPVQAQYRVAVTLAPPTPASPPVLLGLPRQRHDHAAPTDGSATYRRASWVGALVAVPCGPDCRARLASETMTAWLRVSPL